MNKWEKKIVERFWGKHFKMQTQILIILLIMTFVPLIITSLLLYKNAVNTIKDQALVDFGQTAQKTSTLLDTDLKIIKEFTEKINIDSRLYNIFTNLDKKDELSLLRASDEITEILGDYVPWYSDIYSVHLVTSYYRFGEEEKNYYPINDKCKNSG